MLSNGSALQPPLIPVAPTPAHKGWTPNISANPFLPTSAPAPYVNTTFQTQGVNLVQNIYQGPIPISTPLKYPPFKVPGPFYVQQMYPGGPQPQPGQKHIMTRPGPPGNTYEPVGQMPYGVDIHSMPHKQETVQINLNGAKKPQYSGPYQHPPYLIGDPLPQHQVTMPVGNNVQVVPKSQVPVSREPVNVSAANLSNEPPAATKSYPHPFVAKENPGPVEPQLWNNNGPALQPPVIPVAPPPADKKKYSRDQLMELKNMASIELPEKCGIPMDIISAGASTGFRCVLWPATGNIVKLKLGRGRGGAHGGFRSQHYRERNLVKPTIIDSASLREEVELKTTENILDSKPQQGPSAPSQQPSFQKMESIDVDQFKALARDCMDMKLRPMMPGLINSSLGASGSSGRSKTQGSVPMSSPAPPGPQEPTQPPPVVDNKARSTPASDVNRTPPPQISKQVPFTSMLTKPVFLKNNNIAFEKLLAADKDVNYYIEKKYLEFLIYGEHFTDKQDFKIGNNNQYMEEVNILIARCLNHLNEPMLNVHRLEKLYIGFVDKIEKEVNSLGKDKFDARGLTRSLLLDLLAMRPADHIFLTALLISLIEKHKKWGSCVELLKDFLIYCIKSDIKEDYPNIIEVVGDIFGYLICFGSFSLADYKKLLLMKYVESVSSTVFVQMVRCIARLKGPQFLFECFPSEDSIKEYLSPLFYRNYKSNTEFETLDLKEKLQERFKLGFLLDKKLSCDHPYRVNTLKDHLGLVNICLHYYVSSPPDNSSMADYLSLNFPMSSPAVAADVYFALTQKICYESLEPQVSGDEEVVTYKLNDAKFKELYRTRLLSMMQSLDAVLPSHNSLLDVNLYLQRSQFVIVKELFSNDFLAFHAQFKFLNYVPSTEIARVLCRDFVA